MVLLRTDLFLTHAGTASNAVVQAGAIRVHRSRSLAQGKHPLHQKQRATQQAYIDVRAVETIERTAETATPGDEDARIGLAPGDAQVGIFLVVLEQDIEMRLMVLDQVGFKGQGLRFAVGHDELDLAHLTGHQADAGGEVVPTAEVTADATAQAFGFADVEDAVLSIAHQIATWLSGDLLQSLLETVRLRQQRRRRSRGCQGSFSRRSSSRCWPGSAPHHRPPFERFSPHPQTRCDRHVSAGPPHRIPPLRWRR